MNDAMKFDDAVIVALGGNQPFGGSTVRQVLDATLDRLPALGLEVVKRSAWWASQAWPDPSQPAFLNGVAMVRTRLDPQGTMTALLKVERQFGRVRGQANAARTLDLDLIAFGREVIDTPGLVLPHPRAAGRRFVMGPLAEIAPGWRHPVNGRSAAELAVAARIGADARPLDADDGSIASNEEPV
jgi:2-amino-4-hydroxy-6-hydroxymethyldihydropteridine diphosphokinase